MPNRILKESICTSDSIDMLSEFAEIFFYRLIVNCDDFGRMDARPKVLLSRLFPLKRGLTEDCVENLLQELVNADLITLYVVDDKPYLQMNAWLKHQQKRASKSKYPSPDDGICNQMIADDYKCPRNRESYSRNDNRESVSLNEPLMTDEDAHAIQGEHDEILNAAKGAGFDTTPFVCSRLLKLYAEHGRESMINAIAECAIHGASNLAYLEAVLKGGPKKPKPKVNAQDYDQRDYNEVVADIERRQNERILQRLKEEKENQA